MRYLLLIASLLFFDGKCIIKDDFRSPYILENRLDQEVRLVFYNGSDKEERTITIPANGKCEKREQGAYFSYYAFMILYVGEKPFKQKNYWHYTNRAARSPNPTPSDTTTIFTPWLWEDKDGIPIYRISSRDTATIQAEPASNANTEVTPSEDSRANQ